MLRAGVPLKIASGRLGHGSIGITANLYQHLSSDMDAEAAERVAAAMRKTVSNLGRKARLVRLCADWSLATALGPSRETHRPVVA